MKIKEILNESPTDLVAHYHVQGTSDIDQFMNSVARQYSDQTKEYYKNNFKTFFQSGVAPVFTESPEDEYKWSTQPAKDSYQSAGYRGKQYAAARAKQPYDKNVQNQPIAAIGIEQSKGNL
jgi:hypothetical protein